MVVHTNIIGIPYEIIRLWHRLYKLRIIIEIPVMRKYIAIFNLGLFTIAFWPQILQAESEIATPAPTHAYETSPIQQQANEVIDDKTVITPAVPLLETHEPLTPIHVLISLLEQQQTIEIEGEKITSGARVLSGIYQQRQYSPIWTDSEQILTLMSNIATIDEDGLNPDDYHYRTIIGLQQKTEQESINQEDQANLDILMTNSLLRLVYHLKFGKVVPQKLDSNWNYKREFVDDDPIALFNTVLSSNLTLATYLSEQRNLGQFHSFLKQSLKKYRDIALSGGWPIIPKGRSIRPGNRDKRIPQIYQRLLLTGDIQTPAPEKSVSTPEIVAGIKHFQNRHTLKSDGVVGPQTLMAMNVPVSARIDQIRVNMERLRWISPDLKDKFVLIDIAGFQAYLVENQQILWKSKVQVGKLKRQTPAFKDTITYLELNPTWTVPPTILKEDIIPKLQQGIDILGKKGLNVLTKQGQYVDTEFIDWETVSANNFPYMLRQPPGPANALGRIKIMFPNRHAIYLHDTPSKRNFKRSVRTFSSGCVRLQKPFELAELLLGNTDKWNKKKFDRILKSKKTSRINLPEPMPILLVYTTIDFDLGLSTENDDSQITFNPDVYNRDAQVIESLNQPFSFTAPSNISVSL